LESAITKIIDVCLAFDEVDLAEFRAVYYEGIVAHHYFFEASHTHSGKRKRSYLQSSPALVSNRRVTLVQFDIPDSILRKDSRWAVEEFSRDWAMWFVAKKLPDEILLLSDIDELPSREQLEGAVAIASAGKIVTAPLRTSYRFVNWVARDDWRNAKVFRADRARPGLRFLPGHSVPGEKGVHLRYMGYGNQRLAFKHGSFAHGELDGPQFSAPELLRWCDFLALSQLPRFERGDRGTLECLAPSELNSVQKSFYSSRPESLRLYEPIHSLLRREVAYFWICQWARRPSSEPLDRLMANALSGWSRHVFLAIGAILFQRTGIPKLSRVAGRLLSWPFSPSVPGRKLIHILRGVYGFGDQLGSPT
jgi:hypothetical protein